MCSDIAISDLRHAGLPETAEVVVLTIAEVGLPPTRSYGGIDIEFSNDWPRKLEIAESLAESACLRLQKWFPKWQVASETRWGRAADVILDKAKGWPADLVVVGTHGRSGLGRLVLGSVSSKVVNEAPCSVRVARLGITEGEIPPRILIADDGSSAAEAMIDEVLKRSWPAGTEARVVGAAEVFTPAGIGDEFVAGTALVDAGLHEKKRIQNIVERCVGKLQAAGLSASSVVEEGDAARVLIWEAENWKADAIFVGPRGAGRMERLLLGSVSKAVLAHAPCTVEVVRHS
jgi:nucleotide-binding universal stress UspA family protein